jgi:hypothetical protein
LYTVYINYYINSVNVGDLCTVIWRGVRYRVECNPSYLLSLATKVSEGENYFDVYRLIVRDLERNYREAKSLVNSILSEK